MPSASNNQSNTKLVKQTSVNSVNSGGASGTSSGKGNKKLTENAKTNISNTTVISINSETSIIKTAKENTSNVVATVTQQQNKNWETSSAAGNPTASTNISKDAGNDALNPMKLTFTTIEHKIRNLEKRKTKLEGYLCSGKELSSDQRAAVAKYDAVMATLEFARDLVKQMQQFTKDAEKEQKKQARKELIAKAQAETVKIREVLIIQNILSCLTDYTVRNDFLTGDNGAAKIEPSELEILEKFCCDVQTRRPETSEDVPFATSAQKAAEIFSMTIDARPKQYGDTTYENVKRIFHRIQESDYLDKIYLTDVPEPETKAFDNEVQQDSVTNNEESPAAEEVSQEQDLNPVTENEEKHNTEENRATVTGLKTPVKESIAILSQQPLFASEHLDLQQQQQQPQQVNLPNLPPQTGQPLMTAPLASAATAVPSFQPTAPAPHSGGSTPVHVAMYHTTVQQPTSQQLQKIPSNAAIIGGTHSNATGQILANLTPQQQGVQNVPPQTSAQATQQQQQPQQRQVLTSPAGQATVGTGHMPVHNGNQQQSTLPSHFNPTPIHAVEQNFFKQQPLQQQQQYLQQMRPLADVIGSGNFYFLQDSELDSPDLNNQGTQGVPQNTIVFEQQQHPPQQNLPQNNSEQAAPATNQPQQQTSSAQAPIQTQTFTNQSFPQMPPSQQQHPTNVGLMQNNTPSPLFQQQQQQPQQQQKTSNTNSQQIFPPALTQNIPLPHPQQQSQLMMPSANETQQQQQQAAPNLMMMNRLSAAAAPSAPLLQQSQQSLLPQQQHQQQQQQQQINPQNQNLVAAMQQQLPSNTTSGDMSQAPAKTSSFRFENPVVAGLSYDQQIQNKLNAEKVLNAFQDANSVAAATHIHKSDLINEWDEAVLKANSPATNPEDFKTSSSGQVAESSSTKWSAEVNANSPITVQQNQAHKNEWTSSAANANSSNSVTASESNAGGYANESRSESNHWHPQDSNNYSRGAAGGNRGQGGGPNPGGYQRQRNDDRRDDRRPGGSSGGGGGSGGYRGRSNYASGNPQQNGQPRGGGGGGNASGIYFRNNENFSNNNNNSYYQNGNGGGGGSNVYSNKDSRYDSRGNSGGNYRGARGSDNPANPRNGPPPRHMGNRPSGGGNSNANNTNPNSYMNSRQSSNRMPLGIENKN